MEIDSYIPKELDATEDNARRIEADGYDGLWIGESNHDAFLPLLLAGRATERITVGTSVAIAFARTPMTMASVGYDMAEFAKGRFVLGLGTQVKPHIERRFSMPWSHPAPRMHEFIRALRAIWDCWHTGSPLAFEGEFYTHTLMTPFFSPPAHQYGPPPIYLAGVGEKMTEVAGEVADGFFFHPFTTQDYLEQVTLPAIARARDRAGRAPSDVTICGPAFVAVGRDDAELATAIEGTKGQIAFYASTPTYRRVLDHHGWGDLQPQLTTLTKQGRWSEMPALITDEMLAAFAVVGAPREVGTELGRRYSGIIDRVTLYARYPSDPAMWPDVLDAIRSAEVGTGE